MADKRSKRAPGDSPALSFLLSTAKALILIFAVLVVLITGWLSWWWYRPDLFLGPISQRVHSAFLDCRDSGRCENGWHPVSPEAFSVGASRDEVLHRLRLGGFYEQVVEPQMATFLFSGAAFEPFPCSQTYAIRVTFDAFDRLATAEATFNVTPSCL